MTDRREAPVPMFVHEAEAKKLEAEALKESAEARKSSAYAAIAELDLEQKRKTLADLEASDDFYNIYRFISEVKPASVDGCQKMLNIWRRTKPGAPIKIIFTSPGGDVVSGMALWDYLQELRDSGIHLTTETQGMAASMAGILLQAGDDRVMGKESYLLIHQVQAGMMGSYGELEDRMKWLEKVQERILDIFASRAAVAAPDAWRDRRHQEGEALVASARAFIKKEWERTDWWLDSSEALRLGLVDAVR